MAMEIRALRLHAEQAGPSCGFNSAAAARRQPLPTSQAQRFGGSKHQSGCSNSIITPWAALG